MKLLESRVTDGNRTRDNRYHNPQRKTELRTFSARLRALVGTQKRGRERVGAPGADSDLDVLSPLRRSVPGCAS